MYVSFWMMLHWGVATDGLQSNLVGNKTSGHYAEH